MGPGLICGELWRLDSRIDESKNCVKDFWRIGDVNGRDGCFSVLVSVGWLGKGEHVLENGRGEREDEFVNAEVMR